MPTNECDDKDETGDEPLVINEVDDDVLTSSDSVDDTSEEDESSAEEIPQDEYESEHQAMHRIADTIGVRLQEIFHRHVIDAFDCDQVLSTGEEWFGEDDEDVIALRQIMIGEPEPRPEAGLLAACKLALKWQYEGGVSDDEVLDALAEAVDAAEKNLER